MTTRSGNRRSFPAAVLLATILGGCVPGSLQEFDRTIETSDQHRLYEPLAATPQGILERLA